MYKCPTAGPGAHPWHNPQNRLKVFYSLKRRWTKRLPGLQLAEDASEYIAMGWAVHSQLFFFARSSRNQLIRLIEFLNAKNEMLRKRVPRKNIHLKPDEIARILN